MKELAHLFQFIALSSGVLAIYICILLYRSNRYEALKTYLYILIGINFIIFIHVLEAFFKLVIPAEVYNSFLRKIFLYLIVPLAILRLYLSLLFLTFSRQLIHKKRLPKTYYIFALGIFVLLFSIQFFDYNREVGIIIWKLFVYGIHSILFLSILYSFVEIKRNSKKVRIVHRKWIDRFFRLMILYALLGFSLRIVNAIEFKYNLAENPQMFYLGLLALGFNLFNIIYLKKIFINSDTQLLENQDLKKLYKLYNITKREQEIIELICEGKTNKEIAKNLYITPITVRDHSSNIYRKTNTKNRTQLARIFNAAKKN